MHKISRIKSVMYCEYYVSKSFRTRKKKLSNKHFNTARNWGKKINAKFFSLGLYSPPHKIHKIFANKKNSRKENISSISIFITFERQYSFRNIKKLRTY